MDLGLNFLCGFSDMVGKWYGVDLDLNGFISLEEVVVEEGRVVGWSMTLPISSCSLARAHLCCHCCTSLVPTLVEIWLLISLAVLLSQ